MAVHASLRGPGLAWLLTLALTACDSTPDPTSDTDIHIRDSAGIRIVEYAATPSPPTLTLADEPVYTHGTRPGDYLFAGIDSWMGGVLYPDGRAAVSDWESREIVMLSQDGTHHDVIARAGEGPGEVGWSSFLYAGSSGTLLVDDGDNRRLTLFADGSLVRTVSAPSPGEGADLRAHGLDAGGQVLMSSGASSGRGFNAPWKPGHMVRFDLETRQAEPLFTTIFGDDEGRAWLWHWEMPCYIRLRFTVIGPDGTWLGVFEPPDGLELLGVAGEHALVVVKDEMDVESVAAYELVGW